MVERGDLGDAEPLSHGDNGRVDHAEGKVGILVHELRHSLEVVAGELLDLKVTTGELGEKAGFGSWPQSPLDEVARFDHDADGHDKRARKLAQELRALGVVRVGAVRGRVQRPRVTDDHGPRSEAIS